MKTKKASLATVLTAVLVVALVPVAFATSAKNSTDKTRTMEDAQASTVRQYAETVARLTAEREALLQEKTNADLQGDTEIDKALQERAQQMKEEWTAASQQAQWNAARTDASQAAPQTDTEVGENPPATAEDYRSLLALKTAGYKAMTVKEFNAAVLNWANEDYDRTERVTGEIARNQIAPPLTSDELAFATFTVRASNEENAALLRSIRTGKPKEDPVFWQFFTKEATGAQAALAFCRLDCYLSYRIADETVLTVAQRDKALAGAWQDIRQFWENTSLDDLLALGETGVRAKLETIAAAHSGKGITLTLGSPPQFLLEALDERNLS